MKTVHVKAWFGLAFVGENSFFFTSDKHFKSFMSRFPRSYLRKIAKQYGLPEGGDKDVQIKALWEDPRKLTVNMRWKG